MSEIFALVSSGGIYPVIANAVDESVVPTQQETYHSDDGTSVQTTFTQTPVSIPNLQPNTPEVTVTKGAKKKKSAPIAQSKPKKEAKKPVVVAAPAPAPVASPSPPMEVHAQPTPMAIPQIQPVTPVAALAAPPVLIATVRSYEPVASDQLDKIAGRLKIIEELILRHGRAYDYRSHTTAELQDLLDLLDLAEFERESN